MFIINTLFFDAFFWNANELKQTKTYRVDHKYRKKYNTILWFNDNNRDTFLHNFVAFARYTKIDMTLKSIIKTVWHDQKMSKKIYIIFRWLVLNENRRWFDFFNNTNRNIRLRRKSNKFTIKTSYQCYLILNEKNRYVSKNLVVQENIDWLSKEAKNVLFTCEDR